MAMVYPTPRDRAPSFEEVRLHASEITVRKIGFVDLWRSLREGYEDYSVKPHSFLFVVLLYFLGALAVTLFSSGEQLRYLAFPLVAGLAFLGPIVAVAFFGMSRSREQGLDPRWSEAFRFIHTHSLAPILALSLVMTLLYVGWVMMAELIYFGTLGSMPTASVAEFVDLLFSTRAGFLLIAYGNGVGFVFAWAVLATSIVSFPLALDKPVTSGTALSVSVRAFTENAVVLAVWGLIVVALLLVGAALLLIGLAVTLPILGHATWHLYRKLIE